MAKMWKIFPMRKFLKNCGCLAKGRKTSRIYPNVSIEIFSFPGEGKGITELCTIQLQP